jgi:hypothetical protein
MGWRERIIKTLVDATTGKRLDLPTDAYHGSRNFRGQEFKTFPVDQSGTIDRSLGPHFAKDPALSSEGFAGLPYDYNKWLTDPDKSQVLPVRLPPEEAFLKAIQKDHFPQDDYMPLWKRLQTDTNAIETMAAHEAYKAEPDFLQYTLEKTRKIPKDEARALSRAFVQGESARLPGDEKIRSLHDTISNYNLLPHGDDNKQRVVDLARDAWKGQGYAGIKYINTAPLEAGAHGVKDPTSYIVFDPKDIRSRFANMAGDPASLASRDLLRGAVAAPIGLGGMGSLFDESKYEGAR